MGPQGAPAQPTTFTGFVFEALTILLSWNMTRVHTAQPNRREGGQRCPRSHPWVWGWRIQPQGPAAPKPVLFPYQDACLIQEIVTANRLSEGLWPVLTMLLGAELGSQPARGEGLLRRWPCGQGCDLCSSQEAGGSMSWRSPHYQGGCHLEMCGSSPQVC